MPRSDGPFEILDKIGPNAYKVDLPGEYGVSATFNVADLSPYFDPSDDLPSLKTNSHQAGEDDGDQPTLKPKDDEDGDQPTLEPKEDEEVKGVQNMIKEAVSYTHLTLPTNREV